MSAVATALESFREQPTPPEPSNNPFKLDSTLEAAAAMDEIEQAWPSGAASSLVELWTATRQAPAIRRRRIRAVGAGVVVPADSAARTAEERGGRPDDVDPDDVVMGELLGDQELLVVAGDGRILIALSLDDRADWYVAAPDFGEFLDAYWRHGGEKFWERTGG